ncbi:AbrB/MazE/SpoVT family DNA-binding domain-containing protein [Methanogenium marinum]|uniref:AbrB/MazE/SpoVT family DNA-binding domain-containing protein n=1 Tax=Methanogenium marinum TaxID=348610 RepID=A0A9Q4KN01_9EURY|nr:phosphate uptake regulator PhoU [Methanogenium marinum]MDE4907025.1 AbrB/MazE/SpoVT family DNA-binding domain-containing protein [Methanogenium marinum]
MEIRKVQVTGGSSFIVSLPKEWIRASDIHKNDPVGIIIQPDGSLTVTPKILGKVSERVKIFDLAFFDGADILFRSLIGAYVAGYNVIEIVSPGRIPSWAHKSVRKFTQRTVGQEVSDQTDHKIVIRDLLNPGEMPFSSTLKRMGVIVAGMQRDAVFALKTRDEELIEDVILRDRDVNRLYWLVARQFNLMLRNVSLSREMGVDIELALIYLQISRVVERVGDHVVKVAESARSLMYTSLEKKIIDIIEVKSRESLYIFEASLESLFEKDILKANVLISDVRDFVEKCNDISSWLFDLGVPGVVSIGYCVENFRRVGEYAGVISENAINYLVKDDT